MKKKIIFLPAWYPTKDDPVAGSFFKEQAAILVDKFDIYIALITFIPFSIKNLVANSFRCINIFVDDSVPNLPEIHCVAYSHLPERIFRFFIRRNCFKGKILKIVGRRIEDYYDQKRCKVYQTTARKLRNDFSFSPDLVYATAAQATGVEAYMFSKSIDVPFVLAEHSPFPFPDTLVTEKQKEAISKAAAVVSVSNHLSRMILTQGIDCTPIIIGNMIDETIFSITERSTLLSDSHVMHILFVGAYSYFKDYDTFFKCMARLKQLSNRKFKFTIVGYDVSKGYSQGEEKFFNHFALYNIADFGELIPKANRAEMVDYYHKSDLLISTSIQETFGISCLEALACGVPVFATKSGGVEDFIDNDCGRLVDIKDYEGLAKSVDSYFRGEFTFESKAIRAKAIGSYGKEAFSRQISKVFIETINTYKYLDSDH